MRVIPASVKKELFILSGNRCAFPGCDLVLLTDDGGFIGNICYINTTHRSGPRYNPQESDQELIGLDNLILLCPNHHQLIDLQVDTYTAEQLKKIKLAHERKVKDTVSNSSIVQAVLSKISTISLQESLAVWEQNQANGNEEFWQVFFRENPRIIAQAIPNHILMLGQKCYLGGKSIENQGGNIIDFLYVTRSHKNIVLVEIKTPVTKLIGSQYRSNAYSLTEELTGAIIQVLNYRDELLKNYHSLCRTDSLLQFTAFNPQCLIIAGNLDLENLNGIQKKSFELFRSTLNTVTVITFDELFGKVRDLIDIVNS